jgi:anti-sigma regulatory factor (Ser/Thr protein kinase)
VPAARRFTSSAVRSLGAAHVLDDAELLVSELAANVVVHARTPMRVSVLARNGRVRVEVRDDDPTLPQRCSPDPMSPDGRGVMLVDALAEAWGVNGNRRGKTVWFELGARDQAG